jgi:heme/copper-type cytochrome/quinol oxidase subunit 2
MSLGRTAALAFVAAVLLCSALVIAPRAARSVPAHECTITANDFAFSPARIDVKQHEIVRVAFHAVDIPHTFTIDEYRINKRAAIGQTIVFEFVADKAGTFPIYCSLTTDERCRRMKGELVVKP